MNDAPSIVMFFTFIIFALVIIGMLFYSLDRVRRSRNNYKRAYYQLKNNIEKGDSKE